MQAPCAIVSFSYSRYKLWWRRQTIMPARGGLAAMLAHRVEVGEVDVLVASVVGVEVGSGE